VSLAPLPPRNFAPPPCYEYWFWKIKKICIRRCSGIQWHTVYTSIFLWKPVDCIKTGNLHTHARARVVVISEAHFFFFRKASSLITIHSVSFRASTIDDSVVRNVPLRHLGSGYRWFEGMYDLFLQRWGMMDVESLTMWSKRSFEGGKVNMELQLDATITVLLISKISSKCFGQTFAHHQERKT
jgi:hypothetical protein